MYPRRRIMRRPMMRRRVPIMMRRRMPMMRRRVPMMMRRRMPMRRGLSSVSAWGTPYRNPKSLYPHARMQPSKMKSDFMCIYKNPFCAGGVTPKIPDGKAELSCGIRFQNIQEHIMDPDGIMTFIVYPGLGACCRVLGTLASYIIGDAGNTGLVNATGAGGVIYHPLTNHGAWNYSRVGSTLPANASYQTAFTLQQPLNQWRLVSCGLRLSLTNNAQENDGWWEAIRLTIPQDSEYWGYSPLPGTTGADYQQLRIVPTADVATHNQTSGFNIVDHPSYVSGKLRDIHKQMFKLNARNGEHSFTDMYNNVTVDLGAGNYPFPDAVVDPAAASRFSSARTSVYNLPASGGTATTTNTLNAGVGNNVDSVVNQDFLKQNLDTNFDILVIRVHGRPANTLVTTNSTPTRILSHVVSNQELIYPEGTIQARLMSVSNNGPKVSQTQVANLTGNTAAAVGIHTVRNWQS